MIYLDYNATTPIAPEVAEAMLPFIHGNYGNPSSSHELGVTAKKAVEEARAQVAALVRCSPEEILFTSGGSESNNTVIKGVAFTFKNKGNHIITSQIEHPSVLNPCNYLEHSGYRVSCAPVDEYGVVKVSELERLIDDKTILVSIMHSNNETGSLQPMKEISETCRRHGVLFHTDASQSVGKVPVDVHDPVVDFLTIAGHKLYAPKGIGALYMRKGITIEPLIHGAGHESGRRAGTENVIFNVALGKACEIAREALKSDEIRRLTLHLWIALKEKFGHIIRLNGHPEKRLPNTLNVSFSGYGGHEILHNLQDVAASTGSACHSGLTTISPVLKAMGISDEIGRGAVRFSLGRYTTREELGAVIEKLSSLAKISF
jgi:cysteine desulfurase